MRQPNRTQGVVDELIFAYPLRHKDRRIMEGTMAVPASFELEHRHKDDINGLASLLMCLHMYMFICLKTAVALMENPCMFNLRLWGGAVIVRTKCNVSEIFWCSRSWSGVTRTFSILSRCLV